MDDNQIPPEDNQVKGRLSDVTCRIVLKAPYLARLARPDLLWAVNSLAREVTKWTIARDKRLHRLMCYINCTTNHTLTSFIGDNPEDCQLLLFADAGFAGDLGDSKSTTGGVLCIMGQNTFAPLYRICKKQGAVSHSSTEAEVIALDTCLRVEGLPAMDLWSLIVDVFSENQKPQASNPIVQQYNSPFNLDSVPANLPPLLDNCSLIILEDNEAVIKMSKKGRSPTHWQSTQS